MDNINAAAHTFSMTTTGAKNSNIEMNRTTDTIDFKNIVPEKNNRYITVDGKKYPVTTVHNPVFGMLQQDVVEIDGKQYPIETVQDTKACDKTKEVVIIDGNIYNVKDSDEIDFEAIQQVFTDIISNITK